MIELSKHQENALRTEIQSLNTRDELATEQITNHELMVQFHQREIARIRKDLGISVSIHRAHMLSLLGEAGLESEDVTQYGLFEENGKVYLRKQEKK